MPGKERRPVITWQLDRRRQFESLLGVWGEKAEELGKRGDLLSRLPQAREKGVRCRPRDKSSVRRQSDLSELSAPVLRRQSHFLETTLIQGGRETILH